MIKAFCSPRLNSVGDSDTCEETWENEKTEKTKLIIKVISDFILLN